MEKQLGQLMSQLVETLRGIQVQQETIQQSLSKPTSPSHAVISGIQLQAYDEVNEAFDSYVQRLDNYVSLKGVTDPLNKVQIFLHCIGPKFYQIVKNISAPATPETKSYEELVQILKNHIQPEPGEVAQQHKFCLRVQNDHESLANYIAGLKEIGGKCNFICNNCKHTTFETHLRVQFIRGLQCSETKERLLQESSSTKLEDIIKMATAIETSKAETRQMQHEYKSNINKITIKNNKHTYNKNKFNKEKYNKEKYNKEEYKFNKYKNYNLKKDKKQVKCYRCGKDNHKANECHLQYKLFCKKCQTKGHLQSVCFKEQKQLTLEDTESEIEDEIYEINKIPFEHTSNPNDKFNIKLEILGNIHTWELDTGAAVTTCSAEYYNEHFNILKLNNTKIKLKTYTGEIIQPMGTCNIKIKYKDKDIMGRIFVINKNVDPVVGREWIRKLNLHFEVKKIDTEQNDFTEEKFKEKLNNLLQEYKDLFSEEIGEINNYQAAFSLKENVTPIFLKPRPVPFALREKVEEEIDRLEEAGILEKVTYSEWGTPIVPVIKQNGNVRLCADYRATLNKNLSNDNYPIPRIEEIFSKLSGGRYFCILDINQAYLHMKVNAATAEMQAISTCKGTYKVNRLMFGVKIAPNQWQRYMDQTLQGLQGTACFFDDIALQGNTYTELLNRIHIVFQKLRECGLHLNKKKCQFFEKSVKYLGHTINENGLHPTQEKVNDIKMSKQPTDVSSLRTFLGMINYYQQFIPNLASKLNPLYKLLQKDTKFIWTKECENTFQNLKSEICSEKILIPFHVNLPVTLATDASPTGYGAVLSHIMPDKSERPIAFASKSLTKAEKGYSQLDKEAAALIWGLKKFFQYCYGRKITLIIDNQPLARILHPEKAVPATTALRLVHYANFLAGFNYEIKLRKTTEHANADYFSRLQHTTETTDKFTDDDMFYLNQLAVMPVTQKQIKEATAKDPELQQLYHEIQSGKENTRRLHEFSLQNNCIFYGVRIVIPKKLQSEILQELHTAHTGIVKMKALARSYVWWKNIDSDIENMVKECKTCCLLQKNPTKVPIHSWEYPKEPWSRIHIDYAGPFLNNYFLIVVDAYTKWLEVIPTSSITASATINILKIIFTTFGLPITVVSDNGKQFRSEETLRFFKENGIQAKFTAPYHPETNGQAERYVQTFKYKLKSMLNENGTLQEKLSKFLMMYRKTPNNTTGLSPAEMMFKRLYRTRIDLVKRDIYTEMNSKRTTIENKDFKVGERVQIRFYNTTKWKFGIIINKKGKLHYEIDVDGKIHVRHIDQIMKTTCKEKNDVTWYRHLPLPDTLVQESPTQASPMVTDKTEENIQTIPEQTCIIPTTEYLESQTEPQSVSGVPVPTEREMPSRVDTGRRSTRLRRPPTRLNL